MVMGREEKRERLEKSLNMHNDSAGGLPKQKQKKNGIENHHVWTR